MVHDRRLGREDSVVDSRFVKSFLKLKQRSKLIKEGKGSGMVWKRFKKRFVLDALLAYPHVLGAHILTGNNQIKDGASPPFLEVAGR